ncbi:MAG: carboxypeptidase regulatory-like domain-containing protein [Planctomycetes bacterium]|nr:carboxypeptidase regulatory-like domain-containing protein [Planctomycetota bacterium]MBL7144506.1 carboxypeptidase regulatory-like domain-containing protein [Phycisphaerae bacterium]
MNRFSSQVCVLIYFFLSVVAVGQNSNHKVNYTVKVVDINGNLVVGAEVATLEIIFDWADGKKRMDLIEKKTTGSEGTTALNLDFSRHNGACIVARKKSLAFTWDRLDNNALPVDGSELTMLLDKACVLAGTVVDELGKPVAGARVRAELDSSYLDNEHRISAPEDWFTVETDDKGRFHFGNVPPDGSADFLVTAIGKANVYTFMASDSMPGYRYAAGRTDIRIVLPDEAKIQGQVVDSVGKPVAGVRLLIRPDKSVANYYCTNRAISGEDGRFLFENVPDDAYSLQVVAPRDRMAQWVGRDVKIVAKAGQTTDGVVVRLSKGGLVEVVVRDAATKQLAEDVYVSLWQKAGFGKHPCFYQGIRTDRNGRVSFRAPLGQSNVMAGGGEYSRFDGKVVVKTRPSRMRVLLYHNPEFFGTVRDQSGRVVSGATVAVVPQGNAVRTDAKGKFHINWREVSKQAYLFARDEQHNLAAAVEIKDRTRPINIVLKPALTVAGRITDPNGQSIPVARIQFVNRLSGWLAYVGEEIVTDTKGHYEIPAVPPLQKDDIYRINVNAAGYCPLRFEQVSLTKTSNNRVDLSPFVLQPLNMSISGVVVDNVNKFVSNKHIHLRGITGGQEQPRKHTITDTDGRFSFSRISNGPLRLQAGWASDDDEGFLEAQAGDKDVRIVLGQKRVHTGGSSLVGKALPELEQFGLKSASNTEGEKVLVCFWHMEQEASNCVQQLSKREKLLAEEGVDTVLVYAGQIVDSRLNDWLKKNRITIPCGKFDGDITVLGRTWAMQSLPWLILTDRRHIVTAEGFSVTELNGKIKGSGDY